MRLYSLAGATVIDAPEGHFEPDETGGFDALPGPVFDRQHKCAVNGERQWEDEIERSRRLHGEDMARRRDPESLYSAMGDLTKTMGQLASIQLAGTAAPVPADPAGEIAALRKRLAELEAAQPKPGNTGDGEDGEDTNPDEETKGTPKAPAKPRNASPKNTPAA